MKHGRLATVCLQMTLAALAVYALIGCGEKSNVRSPASTTGAAGKGSTAVEGTPPPDSLAVVDGKTLKLDPVTARPGDQVVTLVKSADASGPVRGEALLLERWQDAVWSPLLILRVDRGQKHPASSFPIDRPEGIVDIGLGSEPYRIVIPNVPPGWYRLCVDVQFVDGRATSAGPCAPLR